MNWESGNAPEGWTLKPVGEITKVVGGGTPKTGVKENFSDEEGHPWITPADLSGFEDKYIRRGRRYLTAQGLAASSAKQLPAGTVLFSSRAPIGYVAIAEVPLATNQGFRSFLPSDELDSEYLYYALQYLRPLAEQLASGTTFSEISGSRAAQLPIAYPDRRLQVDIVKALDTAFSKRRSSLDHVNSGRNAVRRFREAVLKAASSGGVGDEESETWQVIPAAELFKWSSGKGLTNVKLLPGEIPVYGGNGISGYHNQALVSEPTIVIGRVGALCGNVYLTRGPAWVTDNAIFAKQIANSILPAWAALVFNGAGLNSRAGGSSQPFVNQKILNAVEVPVPTIEKQREIVRRVERLLGLANSLDERLDKAAQRVNRSSGAILAKAFRGELAVSAGSSAGAESVA